MQLHQINSIRLQPLQGFINLPRGRRLGAAVAFGHEKDFLAVAVTQSLPHANFAGPTIVIPAVVHEGDPLVNGTPDNGYALHLVSLFADMKATQTDGGNFLARPSQQALGHFLLGLGQQNLWRCAGQYRRRRGGLQERASAHYCVNLICRIEPGNLVKSRVHIFVLGEVMVVRALRIDCNLGRSLWSVHPNSSPWNRAAQSWYIRGGAFRPSPSKSDTAAVGAEAGSKARQPPVAFFIGRPVAQGPVQSEEHRGAAHVAALAQHLSAGG